MPTTRSTDSVNRSGLQRGSRISQPSKRKRSNADEHTRKRLKDEISNDVGEEEGDQKVKGGRSGKKAKGTKKRNRLRFVLIPPYLLYSALINFTGKRAWTKHEKTQWQRRPLKHTSKWLLIN